LDDPVPTHEELARNRDAQSLRRIEVDRQIECHRLLDRLVRRLGPPENPVEERGNRSGVHEMVDAQGQQAPELHIIPTRIHPM